MTFKQGQRVANKRGEVGCIEPDDLCDNDPMFSDLSYVRWLTPNNEPSCCCSTVNTCDLIAVPESVVPMQRNATWWAESRAFCAAVEAALNAGDTTLEKP
jgi:hypothetical protein